MRQYFDTRLLEPTTGKLPDVYNNGRGAKFRTDLLRGVGGRVGDELFEWHGYSVDGIMAAFSTWMRGGSSA